MDSYKRKLGDGYVQGYTAALQDALTTINEIQLGLKIHKVRQSGKVYADAIQCMIDNRIVLREREAFVRYRDGKFEVYEEGVGVWNGGKKE